MNTLTAKRLSAGIFMIVMMATMSQVNLTVNQMAAIVGVVWLASVAGLAYIKWSKPAA